MLICFFMICTSFQRFCFTLWRGTPAFPAVQSAPPLLMIPNFIIIIAICQEILLRANRKIVCQNSKISKDIFSDIDECLLWPGRTAITYPSAPTRYQHRPRSTSGQHLPQEYPSLRRASRPASRPAGSHRPSAVGLKNPAASATVCRASCSRSAGEGEREGKEGKKEQRQRIAAPASQHIPNPSFPSQQ